MIIQSLRFRLQLWHATLLVAVLSGLAATAYRATEADQLRRVDEELAAQLEPMFRPPFGGPGQMPGKMPRFAEMPPPPINGAQWMERLRSRITELSTEGAAGRGYYYALFAPDDSIFFKTENTPAQPQRSRVARMRTAADPFPGPLRPPGPALSRSFGSYREAIYDLPHGETLIVGRSVQPELTSLRRFALSLLAAGGALLLLGLAGGWIFVSRAMRPIGVISETAAHISGGDLSKRIAVKETASELGGLARVLNSTFDKLEAAFDRQARFTSDASHELRTPISVMLSQIQLTLARDRSHAEYRDALLTCQRAAQRMRRLTESLLALSRLDANQEPMRREHFDFTRMVHDCLELVRPMARENNVEFVYDLPRVECSGDENRLSQVVLNLTSNAIQFSPNGGTVSIIVGRQENATQLKVSDNGIGISEKDLPHIFDRFYQADKSRSRSDGRSGLGLSICQSIVKGHGGSISVCSVPGSGTAFTVLLPDSPQPPA